MADFKINTVSARQAHETLRAHRSGRGGRTSKFQPVIEEVQNARKGQVVTIEGVQKSQVQTLRSFVYRHLDPEEYVAKSAMEKGKQTYTVAIGRRVDFE